MEWNLVFASKQIHKFATKFATANPFCYSKFRICWQQKLTWQLQNSQIAGRSSAGAQSLRSQVPLTKRAWAGPSRDCKQLGNAAAAARELQDTAFVIGTFSLACEYRQNFI